MYGIIALGLGLLCSIDGMAQTVHQMSVEQAVEYANKNSVQVKNALLDVKIQQQTNKEITAAAYPNLSATMSINDYLDIPTSLLPAELMGGAPGTFIPVQFGTKYNATGGFDVSQLLFDGQVFVGLQARNASIEFANKQKEITEETIEVNVRKIYYQLVVGRQQLSTVSANIERFGKLLDDTKAIYENGFAEKLDVDKVNVQLSNLLTERLKLQNQLDAGNAGLKFLLNMPQKDELILTDTLTEEVLHENILDNAYSYEDRKDFQLLTVSQKLMKYNIKRYKLSYLPTLSLFGSYNKNAQRTEFDFFKGGDWFTTSLIGIRLNVPIFEGFAKNARVEKARLEYQKTTNQLDQLKESIDNDVAQSTIRMTNALVTITSQKQNMQLAEEVYNTTKLKYEQGLGSNQEIYTAQTELKVAQNNYYSALYDAIIAKIDYLKATGKL